MHPPLRKRAIGWGGMQKPADGNHSTDKRRGMLDGEPSGTISVRSEVDAVVLIYRARSFLAAGWKSIEQRVPITWTHCHFGGRRPWFICSVRTNGRYCGRRVMLLWVSLRQPAERPAGSQCQPVEENQDAAWRQPGSIRSDA
jgi:hypothetical protein